MDSIAELTRKATCRSTTDRSPHRRLLWAWLWLWVWRSTWAPVWESKWVQAWAWVWALYRRMPSAPGQRSAGGEYSANHRNHHLSLSNDYRPG